MSSEVRVVKSPLPHGVEKLPELVSNGFPVINITLESGTSITNLQQFGKDEAEEASVEEP